MITKIAYYIMVSDGGKVRTKAWEADSIECAREALVGFAKNRRSRKTKFTIVKETTTQEDVE